MDDPLRIDASKNSPDPSPIWRRTVSLMFVLTLLGQIMAFVRDATIAAKFGANVTTDAFFLAILLPNALLLCVQNGFTMAVVPTLVNKLATEGEDRAWQIISNLMNLSLALIIVLVVIMIGFAEPIVTMLAPSASAETHTLAVSMLRPLTLIGLLGGLATMLTALLNVYRQYALPTLFGLVMNLSIVIGVLTLADTLSWRVLVGSTLVGHLTQILILCRPLSKLQRYSYIFRPRATYLADIFRLAWPAIALLLFQQIVVIVDRNIASSFGVGNVAALTFAARLVLPIAALLIGPLATITLPEMARVVTRNDSEHTQYLASSILRHTLFFLLPVAIILYTVSGSLVSLVFQRGEFVQTSVQLTAGIMIFYVPTLVGVGLRQVIVQIFFAARDSKVPLVSGAVRMAINLILNVILARSMGIRGIAMANGLAIIVDVVIMSWIMIRRKQLKIEFIFFLRITGVVIITAFIAITVHGMTQASLFGQPVFLKNVVIVAITAISTIAAYLGSSILLKMSEGDIFINVIRNWAARFPKSTSTRPF